MKHTALLTAIAFLATVRVGSAIEFNLQAEIGGDSLVFPTTTYALLLADTANDGFQGLLDTWLLEGATNASVGSLLGSNDLVIATNLTVIDLGSNQNGVTLGLTHFDTADYGAATWSSNAPLGILWFSTGFSGTGDPFYFYRSNSIQLNSDIAFFTPVNAATVTLLDRSTAVGGGTASYITGYPSGSPAQGGLSGTISPIPEPSTIAFLVSVGLAFPFVRRFARLGKM